MTAPMSIPPSPRPVPGGAWWTRAYGLALRALPAAFREQWAADMRRTFADLVRHARTDGGRALWALVAREVTNVVVAGLRERLHVHRQTRVNAHSHATRAPSDMLHFQDVRYAFRLLARSPGFALLTVLVLAGGLGVSTFAFSFLHTAMIRPLPLDEGERIVRLTAVSEGRRGPVDVVDLPALQASMRTVRHLGGYTRREVIVGRAGEGRVVAATVADPQLFVVARTPALLGRALLPADAAPGAEPAMVLTHRTWETAFGADPAVVGMHVPVNGVSTRIVGVMPPGFGFPAAPGAWLPLPATAGTRVAPGTEAMSLFARLAPGATHAQAAAEATALLRRVLAARDTAGGPATRRAMLVESFPAAQIGDERPVVFAVLNVLAGLILLLALVNVTTLLTARANERVRETAVRMALGASHARVVMQGLWESVILCVAGGLLGTAGAAWALATVTRWTRANIESNLAFWWVWEADRVTLLAAAAFVIAAVAVLGGVVAARATRTNVREVLQDGSARAGSRREGRLARGLVATQVAVVTVLMFVGVLSGIMARRVVDLDPGYDPTNLLQATLAPPPERFPTDADRAAVFRRTQERLTTHAALDGALLRARLAERGDAAGRFARRGAGTPRSLPTAHVHATLGALSTLGIRAMAGRLLEASDDTAQVPVALVSQSLAARFWRGRSPVGEQVRLAGLGDSLQWRTIVGVVSDVPYGNLLSRDRSPDAIYVPLLQAGAQDVEVVVRHRVGEVAGRQALHQVFGAVDPLLVPGYVYRATEVIRKSGLIATGMTKLFGGCFAFALLLAVAGTYGLMSRAIALRAREIGVRRALGAPVATVTRMLLVQGARQLGIGAVAAAPVLVAIGVASNRLFSLGGALAAAAGVAVSAAIIGIVVMATWVPTRRVVRMSPREALWRD